MLGKKNSKVPAGFCRNGGKSAKGGSLGKAEIGKAKNRNSQALECVTAINPIENFWEL